jgi:hypothetical protein
VMLDSTTGGGLCWGADKYFGRTVHRHIVVQPHPRRFKKHLPILIGEVAKTVQVAQQSTSS